MKIGFDKNGVITREIDEEAKNKVLLAITQASPRDWAEFFEFQRQVQYGQINTATAVEQLQILQSNVKAFYLVQQIFTNISRDKKMT